MYVYHYCAQYQERPGSTTFLDGIIQRSTPLRDWDQYQVMKRQILKETNQPDEVNLSITSLTLLEHREDN